MFFFFSFDPQVNFDARCGEDGTRLAVPKDSLQTQAVVDWILAQDPWSDGSLGVRIRYEIKLSNLGNRKKINRCQHIPC